MRSGTTTAPGRSSPTWAARSGLAVATAATSSPARARSGAWNARPAPPYPTRPTRGPPLLELVMRLKVATPWLHGDMSGERGAGSSSRAPAWSRGLAAAAAFVAVSLTAACTTDTPTGTASSPITTTATTAATTPPTTSTGPPSTESTVPPSATGSATYFTPTDPSSFAMTGRIAVEQALQDPFSNLLQRGALHDQPVTLDVVGTPDYPVTPAAGVTDPLRYLPLRRPRLGAAAHGGGRGRGAGRGQRRRRDPRPVPAGGDGQRRDHPEAGVTRPTPSGHPTNW